MLYGGLLSRNSNAFGFSKTRGAIEAVGWCNPVVLRSNRLRGYSRSIEMFICRIKIWCTQDQYRHLANRSMSDSRGNQNGILGCHRDLFPVQNDGSIRLAGQNDVNFSVLLVVMFACVGADSCQVYCAREFVSISKSPTSDTARAGDSRQGSQIDNCWLGWQDQALPKVGMAQVI